MKKILVAIFASLISVSLLAQFYFDTYPTYFARQVRLTSAECGQLAAGVAAEILVAQNLDPKAIMPPQVYQEYLDRTRLVKRVQKEILAQNDASVLEAVDAPLVYNWLASVCRQGGGRLDLDATPGESVQSPQKEEPKNVQKI